MNQLKLFSPLCLSDRFTSKVSAGDRRGLAALNLHLNKSLFYCHNNRGNENKSSLIERHWPFSSINEIKNFKCEATFVNLSFFFLSNYVRAEFIAFNFFGQRLTL